MRLPKLLQTDFSLWARIVCMSCAAVFGSFTFTSDADAQTSRKFGNKVPTVKLCPRDQCVAVNGHGYKPGGDAQVFETKGGWARVSGYLDRAKLVKSFGEATPQKPALWVRVSSLAGNNSAKKATSKPESKVAKKPAKPAKQKVTQRRVNVIDRLARLRNVPRPSFRPGSTFVASATVAPQVESISDPEPIVRETIVVETVPTVSSEPTVSAPLPIGETGGKTKALTWEQVQARLSGAKSEPASTAEKVTTTQDTVPKVDLAAQRQVEAKRMAEEAAAQAAIMEAKRQSELKAQAEAQDKVKAQAKAETEAKAKAEAQQAARALEAEEAAKSEREAQAKRAAEAAQAEQAAQAEREAQAKRDAEAAQAKQKKMTEEAQKAAEAALSTSAVEETTDTTVGYKPPTVEQEPKATAETAPTPESAPKPTAKAMVLPPVIKSEEVTEADKEPETETVKTAKVTQDTVPNRAVNAQPMSLGPRPKTITKALLDKRLSKLPGPKSGVRKEAVIALRHYALGLLENGECTGIARGGPSAVPQTLYIACTDDPTYLRQFPMVEESW